MAKLKKDNRWDDIKGGNAFIVPVQLLRHPNFARLSPFANKLVMDLARQFSGYNNGYLCASRSLMKDCGWTAPHTLGLAVQELEHYRIIIRSRQGGRNRATLHAFTWRRIDQKADKPLDLHPTMKPTDDWEEIQPDFVRSTGKRKARKAAKKGSGATR